VAAMSDRDKKQQKVRDSIEIGSRGHYQAKLREKQGLKYPEYLNNVARRLGFKSYYAYVCHWRKTKKGVFTQREYLEQLAEKKGVRTVTQYIWKLKRARAQRPRYKHLAETLRTRMGELGITRAELARRTEIPRGYIGNYVRGYFYPRQKNLKKIIDALRLDYTIDLNRKRG